MIFDKSMKVTSCIYRGSRCFAQEREETDGFFVQIDIVLQHKKHAGRPDNFKIKYIVNPGNIIYNITCQRKEYMLIQAYSCAGKSDTY